MADQWGRLVGMPNQRSTQIEEEPFKRSATWAPADEVRTVRLHQPLVDKYGRLKDLPVLGITVELRVELSRWRCRNQG